LKLLEVSKSMLDKIQPAKLQEHLGGINYPASKQDLISYAEEKEAPQQLISALRKLPERQFNGPAEVNQAVAAQT
jgi:hypothetical protein